MPKLNALLRVYDGRIPSTDLHAAHVQKVLRATIGEWTVVSGEQDD